MMNHKNGIPIIIAAPSGAGKTSLVNALMATLPNLMVSISHTTRPRRPGEEDDLNYHFVDDAAFDAMVIEGIFLEHAEVFGYRYGTSERWLRQQLQAGQDVILEIDWQGARQIREKMPEVVSIFILPPSYAVLRERLTQRAQDDETVIDARMQQARTEISHYREFDYLVVNDVFDIAVADLQAIIRAQHLAQEHHRQKLTKLLTNLLA